MIFPSSSPEDFAKPGRPIVGGLIFLHLGERAKAAVYPPHRDTIEACVFDS